MVSSWWPLADLRLRTPELELRWPSLNDLDVLAGLAAAGVHDPEVQPFTVAWTDATPAGTRPWHAAISLVPLGLVDAVGLDAGARGGP
jgi:hypothetical protein